jgi:hypothetical protein
MRKNIVVIGIILIVAIIGFGVLFWFVQNKPVRFTLEGNGYSVIIYDDENKQITTIPNSGTIRLTEGTYTYKVSGDMYDDGLIDFTVQGQTTDVKVSPKLSSGRLNELLAKEQLPIETSLKNQYLATTYTITALSLYEEGDWAAGTLQLVVDPRQLPDTYRFVMKKEGQNWKVVVTPRIVITQADFPNVPKNILHSLYSAG